MAENFYTILTKIGKAKMANAYALGNKLNLVHFAVGDGNGAYYNPTEEQTQLKREVWRGNISSLDIDPVNPNWIVAEAVIPSADGGFMMREAALIDDTGDIVAIGKYPETYKPIISEGSAKDLYIKMIIEISNSSSVSLKIDPSVILATKKDIQNVNTEIQNNKQSINNLATSLADIAINAKQFGAIGDGVTDDSQALINTNAINGNVHISKGTFKVKSNITIGNLYISNGGKLLVDSGITVTIGHVICDYSTQCFTGLGKVIIQDNFYSLAWYEGISANKKWDFMRRGFQQVQGVHKYVYVPIPKLTDEAVTLNEFNNPAWAVDGALYFDDPEDDLIFDCVGKFRAVTGCTDMFVFSPNNKTEEITFPKGLILEGGGETDVIANNGIVLHGGARIKFMGVVRCKYFKEYGVEQDCSIASCDEVQFDFLECTGFGIAGMLVASSTGANLYGYVNYFFSNGAFATGEAFIKIEGTIRNFTINKFIENVVTSGSLTDVISAQILISSLAIGVPKNVVIREIYSAYSNKLMLKTINNGGSQKITALKAEQLYGNTSSGVSLSYVMQSFVSDVFGIGNVSVATDCEKLSLNNIYIPIVGTCKLLSIDGKLSNSSVIATNSVIEIVALPNGVYSIDTDSIDNQCVFMISADTITILTAGSNINVIPNTHLYGTTGLAGKLNISFYNGVYFYIENRTGVSLTTVFKSL